MNKKAQELSEWYAKLAENNNGWSLSSGGAGTSGPDMNSILSKFTVNPPKPVKKIIDLSVCIESGIDMEFCSAPFRAKSSPVIDVLTNINILDQTCRYMTKNFGKSEYCRVRQDNWHSWQGGERPIPKGLTGEIQLRDKTKESLLTANKWNYDGDYIDSEIIAFKITGIADGYRYEWMEE